MKLKKFNLNFQSNTEMNLFYSELDYLGLTRPDVQQELFDCEPKILDGIVLSKWRKLGPINLNHLIYEGKIQINKGSEMNLREISVDPVMNTRILELNEPVVVGSGYGDSRL